MTKDRNPRGDGVISLTDSLIHLNIRPIFTMFSLPSKKCMIPKFGPFHNTKTPSTLQLLARPNKELPLL